MVQMLNDTLENALNSGKLIHCITNPISINLCANGILALGCRPIMAEHPREVREVTSTADSLLLNCGNLTDARIKSMSISAKRAAERGIPIVLDAVGAACIGMRRKLALKLMKKYHPAVVKGNASEICALYRKSYRSGGIDADKGLSEDDVRKAAETVAADYSTVVLVSGKRDIVTDGGRTVCISNGTEKLTRITGTGCLLGALTAVTVTGGDAFSAAVSACGILGIAAENIPDDTPNGTFAVKLLDMLSGVKVSEIPAKINIDEVHLANM